MGGQWRGRTLWIAGAAICLIVLAILWLRPGDRADLPPVMASLSARHTAAVASVEHIDRWSAQMAEALQTLALPDLVKEPLAPLLDPKVRAERLGFDPTTPAGWQSVGLDPAAGVAVVADARMQDGGVPWPVVLVRVQDDAKLRTFLEKQLKAPVPPALLAGPPARVVVAGTPVVAARLAEWTALTLPLAAATPEKPLGQMAAADEPKLSSDPVFQAALAELPPGERLTAYASVDGARPLLDAWVARLPDEGLRTRAKSWIAHESKLFRALAAHVGRDAAGARLVASAEGVQVLRQCLVPEGQTPPLGRHLPAKGWLGLRISMDLPQVFDGLLALVPADALEVRTALGGARLGLWMVAGLAWDEIAKGLTGHLILGMATQAGPDGQRDWLAVAAVRDVAQTDQLVARLVELATRRGFSGGAVTVDGAAGHRLTLLGQSAVLVRAGDRLVLAPSEAAVRAALQRKVADSLAGTPLGALVDGPAVLVAVAPLPGGTPWSMDLQVDDHGLVLRSSGGSLAALGALQTWLRR